ncbi:MAG: GEGP motif-containing diheme protein [Thermodesulfobacteriota bacterium]|nr:GEGP motif-containing diheme protein [Thermodesulfobacteriota bacterium]
MKSKIFIFILSMMLLYGIAKTAYHHEGEIDAPKFITAYPDCEGTKLDSCALCHSGGQYEKKPGKWVEVGSCQWCHRDDVYGYSGTGDADLTLNEFGRDYRDNGRNVAAFAAIEDIDSDGDGYTNKEEIDTLHYPGDSDDDLTKIPSPRVVYTMNDIGELSRHKQFLLMNASRKNDLYGEYEGVTIADLIDDAGMLDSATGVTVFAPDGYFYTYDLNSGGDYYYVYGTYPQAQFYYVPEADLANGGWCDYSAPSCIGRNDGDLIYVENGLKLILAYKIDGAFLEPGYLDETNRLAGEGPFRAVPPQMISGPPDQSSTSTNQDVYWPYDENADHNAGFSCRTVVAVRIEPLPEGTIDFNWYEGGWDYVDNQEVIIYGAIASGNLDGKATDKDTGNTISGVTIKTDKGGYLTKTDSRGNYSIKGMKPDTYTLTASATGYGSKSRTVTISKDTTQTADFILKKSLLPPCPVEESLKGETANLELIRQFRDEKLAKNPLGKTYIRLYYRNAKEILTIALSKNELQKEIKGLIHQILPHIKDVLEGKGASLSEEHMSFVNKLLDKFAFQGSKDLKRTIKRIKNDLLDVDFLKRITG